MGPSGSGAGGSDLALSYSRWPFPTQQGTGPPPVLDSRFLVSPRKEQFLPTRPSRRSGDWQLLPRDLPKSIIGGQVQ